MKLAPITLLIVAMTIFGAYLLTAVALSDDHLTPAVILVGLVVALPPALLARRPNPLNDKTRGARIAAFVVSAWLIFATALLVAWMEYTLHVGRLLLGPSDIPSYGMFFVPPISAIVAGITLTLLEKNRTLSSLCRIWFWSIGLFLVQFVYCYILLLLSLGPIL